MRWTIAYLSMGHLGNKLLNLFYTKYFTPLKLNFTLQNQGSNLMNLNSMMNLNCIIGNIQDA